MAWERANGRPPTEAELNRMLVRSPADPMPERSHDRSPVGTIGRDTLEHWDAAGWRAWSSARYRVLGPCGRDRPSDGRLWWWYHAGRRRAELGWQPTCRRRKSRSRPRPRSPEATRVHRSLPRSRHQAEEDSAADQEAIYRLLQAARLGWRSSDVDCGDFDTHAHAQSFFKGTGGRSPTIRTDSTLTTTASACESSFPTVRRSLVAGVPRRRHRGWCRPRTPVADRGRRSRPDGARRSLAHQPHRAPTQSDQDRPAGPRPDARRDQPGCDPGQSRVDCLQSGLGGDRRARHPPTPARSSWPRSIEYGYADRNPAHYQEDHLVPLELGGAPRDPRNLWPQPNDGDAARRNGHWKQGKG